MAHETSEALKSEMTKALNVWNLVFEIMVKLIILTQDLSDTAVVANNNFYL